MRGAEFDARARGVDEVQQGGWAANPRQLLAPAGPGRLGDVRGRVPRVTEAQGVRSSHLVLRTGQFAARVRLKVVVFRLSIGMPHRATLSADRLFLVEAARSFAQTSPVNWGHG